MIFIRHIYAYRLKDTNTYVYVGSASDINKRDRLHTKAPRIPFDKFLIKRGRESFTLDTVDIITGKTEFDAKRKAVERENFWMHSLKTWHTNGPQSFNFMPAFHNYKSEEHLEASKVAQKAGIERLKHDPAFHKALLIGKNKRIKNPQWRKNVTAAVISKNKKMAQDPIFISALVSRNKDQAKDPSWRVATLAGIKNSQSNPKHKKKRRAAMLRLWRSTEHRKKVSAAVAKANSERWLKTVAWG